jgi:hypothetical protein
MKVFTSLAVSPLKIEAVKASQSAIFRPKLISIDIRDRKNVFTEYAREQPSSKSY